MVYWIWLMPAAMVGCLLGMLIIGFLDAGLFKKACEKAYLKGHKEGYRDGRAKFGKKI